MIGLFEYGMTLSVRTYYSPMDDRIGDERIAKNQMAQSVTVDFPYECCGDTQPIYRAPVGTLDSFRRCMLESPTLDRGR